MKASLLLSLQENLIGFFYQCYLRMLWNPLVGFFIIGIYHCWFLSRLIFITGFILHTSWHHSWAFSNLFWGSPLRAFNPFCTLIPNHSRVMGRLLNSEFCFLLFVVGFFYSLPQLLRIWEEVFYPHLFFTLHSFPKFCGCTATTCC